MSAQERGRVRSSEALRIPNSLALCVLLLSGGARATAETANRIVVVINDEAITEADVASSLHVLFSSKQAPPADADPRDVRRMVLRHLIEQRLILQEARRAKIDVTESEVADRLRAIRERFSSEEEFRRSLEQSDLSRERLKEQIRDQLLVDRLIDAKIRSTIVVSPQEVAREIGVHPELSKSGDRVQASHLLVRVNDTRSESRARELIEDIRRQLEKGADLATRAKRYSEDPSGVEGGAMGWVAQGELLPELDAALFSLKEGELSSPIQTRLGFHLVRVEERRTASSLSLMEANHAVYQRIYQEKFQQAFNRWIDELKHKAYIDIIDTA